MWDVTNYVLLKMNISSNQFVTVGGDIYDDDDPRHLHHLEINKYNYVRNIRKHG